MFLELTKMIILKFLYLFETKAIVDNFDNIFISRNHLDQIILL